MGLSDSIVVRINAKGEPLKLGLGSQVLRFIYEDTEKEDDMVTVVFADPSGTLIDSDQFTENTEWTVQWGFPNRLFPARKVLVKRPKYRWGEVEVECLDKGSLLKVEERWKIYKQTTMNEVVGDIAKRHQLKAQLNGLDKSMDAFVYGGRTDYDVLKYFEARLDNHIFKIKDDTLIFQERKMDEAPKATYQYAPGSDSRLIDFEITVKDQDNAKSSNQTSTLGVDPYIFKNETKKSDEGESPTTNLGQRRVTDSIKSDFTSKISNKSLKGGIVGSSESAESTGKALVMPFNSTDELKSAANSKRNKALLDSTEASFTIMAAPDDPFLTSGNMIQIGGIGKKFSGPYRIAKITHDLSNGFVYKLDCRRNAVGSTGKNPKSKLNGVLNNRNSIPNTPESNVVGVLGSKSKSLYGSSGRLIG